MATVLPSAMCFATVPPAEISTSSGWAAMAKMSTLNSFILQK
jgi:hypothetical protein